MIAIALRLVGWSSQSRHSLVMLQPTACSSRPEVVPSPKLPLSPKSPAQLHFQTRAGAGAALTRLGTSLEHFFRDALNSTTTLSQLSQAISTTTTLLSPLLRG